VHYYFVVCISGSVCNAKHTLENLGAYEAMFAENRRATKDASSIHQISKTFMDYFALASDLEKAKQQEELVVLEQSMNQVESHWRELSEQQRKQRGEIQTLTYDFQVRYHLAILSEMGEAY
jgi:hypothetical protein